ncbi:hypothetical protein P8452_56620 [Trifolium repens]|nr:hypothetical protein P8452_56620 [Trifolium repens]
MKIPSSSSLGLFLGLLLLSLTPSSMQFVVEQNSLRVTSPDSIKGHTIARLATFEYLNTVVAWLVLKENNVNKEELKVRATDLKILGKIFKFLKYKFMPTKRMQLRPEEEVVCHDIFTGHVGDKEQSMEQNKANEVVDVDESNHPVEGFKSQPVMVDSQASESSKSKSVPQALAVISPAHVEQQNKFSLLVNDDVEVDQPANEQHDNVDQPVINADSEVEFDDNEQHDNDNVLQNNDVVPIVFKVGDNCWALRTDFQCMIPNGWVGDRIITMMINAITWNQKNTYNKEVWWLPPLFATQVGLNTKNEMLEFMFGDQFMPQIDKLKLIYVPIEDHDFYHWYLMVINLPEKKIYHLDTSLSQLALSIFEKDIPHCTFPDFDGWEIVEPRGIPNYGHIGNSGLWVAEWLQMQSCFNSQVVGSSMDESILRIKMVMALLLGAHNECREVLIEAANELWLKLHVKHEEAQMLKK